MERCKATNRQGEQCGNLAMKGRTVCRIHGGKSPQVIEAAERRLTLKRAERMVQLAGEDMDPVEHILDCLYRQRALVGAYGLLISELDDADLTETNKLGDRKMHTFVVAYEQAIRECARIAKMCGDLKVGERQIQFAERYGEHLAVIFERTWSAVKGLTAEQRAMAAEAFAGQVALLERPAIDGTARAA